MARPTKILWKFDTESACCRMLTWPCCAAPANSTP